MASLRSNPDLSARIRCLVRQQWVTATPEERVRQRLLAYMTDELGYSRQWLCVEKPLAELPHLALSPTSRLPRRRIDLLCYAHQTLPEGTLRPLILLECKAVPITPSAVRQVIGYNCYVKAPYLCLVNTFEIRFGTYDLASRSYQFTSRLPSYREVM